MAIIADIIITLLQLRNMKNKHFNQIETVYSSSTSSTNYLRQRGKHNAGCWKIALMMMMMRHGFEFPSVTWGAEHEGVDLECVVCRSECVAVLALCTHVELVSAVGRHGNASKTCNFLKAASLACIARYCHISFEFVALENKLPHS